MSAIPALALQPEQLVRRLRSPRQVEQLTAARNLRQLALAGSSADCEQLLAAGCLPPLLQLLRSSSAVVRHSAAAALCQLGARSSCARATSAAAVPSLVAMCSGSEPGAGEAAYALANVAHANPEGAAAVLAAGGHAALVRLAVDTRADVQHAACAALVNLSYHGDSATALIGAGAFPALVSVLQRTTSTASGEAGRIERRVRIDPSGVQTAHTTVKLAADTTVNLCWENSWDEQGSYLHPVHKAVSAAAAAGVPSALAHLLRSQPEEAEQRSAAAALNSLAASQDPAVCDAIVAAGGLELLAERLTDGSQMCSPETTRVCLSALCQLVTYSPGRCAALAATPGLLLRLVQLIDGSAGDGAARHAAVLLACLSAAGEELAAAVAATGAEATLAAQLSALPSIHFRSLSTASSARLLAALQQTAPRLAASLAQGLQQLTASSDPDDHRYAAEALRPLRQQPIPAPPADALAGWSVRRLRQFLAARGVDASGCVEKGELVALAQQAAAAAPVQPAAANPATEGQQAPAGTGQQRACQACGKTREQLRGEGGRLFKCSRCRAAFFCSDACMAAAWPQHKRACRAAGGAAQA